MPEEISSDVVASQRGDREAFERLVTRFQRQVFFTVFRVLQDPHLSDDVTQEVFVKAYRALPGLQDPAIFKSWLLRIAMNRAIDFKRRTKREREQAFLFDDEPAGLGAETPALQGPETAELGKALAEALGTLPPKMQKVIALSMDGELNQETAAEILDCPVGTVKSRLFHARRLLREKLRKYLG
ncbi:MAG: sigma-70 family RNA polymerase sigma factor [Candidatus Wallbacteria bacterium]|nr:sigma-70 family RNA polymerase sigma factor [Candidatus Wallbacteria bacterium]